MKLDRNINDNGMGKYALLNLRRLNDYRKPDDPFQKLAEPVADALKLLEDSGILEWASKDTDKEFFLIRLKDKYAGDALAAYAVAAMADDPEYAQDIAEMADRAGLNSPWCKAPD